MREREGGRREGEGEEERREGEGEGEGEGERGGVSFGLAVRGKSEGGEELS